MHLSGLISSFLLPFSKLDEQMPCLPPPSSEAVAALVRELRAQLDMALFGVDVIINIHTHTLTVIDINIFPGTTSRLHRHLQRPNVCGVLTVLLSLSGYEGVPQFFSSLLSHIELVLGKRTSAENPATGCLESAQTTGDPSASSTGLWDIIIECFSSFLGQIKSLASPFYCLVWVKLSSFQDLASVVRSYL